MSEVYEPPAWAAAPRPDISLEVLKGGVIVQHLRFSDQDHYVIGRVPSSDFQFEHPSISRQHAVLQFGEGGSLHVFDFGSTHGTFVNKLRIKSKEYQKLNIGDVLKFGESTRLYIVAGPAEELPEEYDSENLRRLRLKAHLQNKFSEGAELKQQQGEEQASWGFDDDAVNEESGSDASGSDVDEDELPEYLKTAAQKAKRRDLKVGLKSSDVTDKDQKAFQKLQKLLQKVENLHIENERITAKEGAQSGLTA
eukprot:8485-Heterococcus_DN1.PRE.1